jgi:hypothetical protein
MDIEEIDLEGVIAALETELPNVEHYLDLRTGRVLSIVKTDARNDVARLDAVAQENLVLSQRVQADPNAYERIPSIASDAGFKWMQEWASTVADEQLRTKLRHVLNSCSESCFKAFRNALGHASEEERERWFAFREEKLVEFVTEWVSGKGTNGHS